MTGKSDTVERSREGLVFHFPHYQTQVTPHSAILLDGYKLLKSHETGRVKLFHLDKDPREQNDLAKTKTDLAASLEAKLDAAGVPWTPGR